MTEESQSGALSFMINALACVIRKIGVARREGPINDSPGTV